jgi:hypothetical protein
MVLHVKSEFAAWFWYYLLNFLKSQLYYIGAASFFHHHASGISRYGPRVSSFLLRTLDPSQPVVERITGRGLFGTERLPNDDALWRMTGLGGACA